MSNKTLEEKIIVMQHFAAGGKIILNGELWGSCSIPSFDWEHYDYSIYEEPKTLPSINWEHVSEEYKYLATDDNGGTFLYTDLPKLSTKINWWNCSGKYINTNAFSSFKEGTCYWKDSLVKRPE